MKKFILALLFPFMLSGQDDGSLTYSYEQDGTTYQFKYTACLKPFIEEYFSNTEKLKHMDLELLGNLVAIYHMSMLGPFSDFYGINTPPLDGCTYIYINSDKVQHAFPTFLTAVLYHELYHQFFPGEGHCQGSVCPYILRAGEFIKPEVVVRNFNDYEKKKYFDYIIKRQKK